MNCKCCAYRGLCASKCAKFKRGAKLKGGPCPVAKGLVVGAKVAACAAVGAAALTGAAAVGVGVWQRVKASQFYDRSLREFPVPGIDKGFVPQDLCYVDEDGSWLFSGYESGGTASPLYRRLPDGSVRRITLRQLDGSWYWGHGAAVAVNGPWAYVTDEAGCMVFHLADVLAAEDGTFVRAVGEVPFGLVPAFMSTDDTYLYAGEYYFPKHFETPAEHRLTSPSGVHNPAILFGFKLDADAPFGLQATPSLAMSIPAEVQGMAMSPDGEPTLSTSWALGLSHILLYDGARLDWSQEFLVDGKPVPLAFLEPSVLTEDLLAPPMSEGIVWQDGRVWVPFESASNRYVFGKLYRAGDVFSVDMMHV